MFRLSSLALTVALVAGCPGDSLPGNLPDLAMTPPCADHVKDGDETDVDCGGGTCQPCSAGQGCAKGSDCQSTFCTNRACDAPSCSDGVKNGFETNIDCGGGICAGCANGQPCMLGEDCLSMTCTNGACVPGPCMNGKLDGMETDIDCGGPVCAKCDDGKMCSVGADCKGMMCTNGMCQGEFMCTPPMANCDGNVASGCNINLDTDAMNCGQCSKVCPVDKPACTKGACGAQTVLVLAATGPPRLGDVQATLVKTAAFARVDTMDATVQTPTLKQLMAYDAVLVFDGSGFQDYKTTGDNLADYIDAGGRVVLAPLVTLRDRLCTQGRLATDKYVLVAGGNGNIDSSADTLGKLNEPMSPLVAGVAQLSSDMTLRPPNLSVLNGGIVVAEWANGAPLIVRGVVRGRNRVDLNLFPPSSNAEPYDWKGDGGNLLRNALLYQ